MTRFSSAVAISILGFCFAYGCSDKNNGDEDEDPTATNTGNTGIITGTGGTSGTNTQSATSSGTNGSGGSGTNSGTSTTGETLGEACPMHEMLGTCGKGAVSAKPKPVNMLIVLDKSGSMNQMTNGQEKWGAMKGALDVALAEVANDINFGLELYPTPALGSDTIDANNCGDVGNCCEMPDNITMNVPIGEGSAAVDLISQTLDDTEPGGGTPTARALERALEYFTTGAGKDLEGDKFVLLATDGGPNCNDALTCGADLCTYNLDERDCSAFADNNCCETGGTGCVDSSNVVDRIERLKNADIDTFVVGIPGSEAYSDFLDDFADAGGRAVKGADNSYYRVDDVAELTDVFKEITVQLVTSCELEIPQSSSTLPPKVVIDCDLIDRFQGAGGAGNDSQTPNWEWTAGSETLTLVGDVCERVQAGVDRIDVVVDCDDVQ